MTIQCEELLKMTEIQHVIVIFLPNPLTWGWGAWFMYAIYALCNSAVNHTAAIF